MGGKIWAGVIGMLQTEDSMRYIQGHKLHFVSILEPYFLELQGSCGA